MNGKKNFKKVQNLVDNEGLSITSKDFYIRYCKKENLNQGQYLSVKQALEKAFPENKGGFAAVSNSELGAVVAILPQSPEFEKDMLFGYASIDHFNNVCLIPETGTKLFFKGSEDKDKADLILASKSNLQRQQAYEFYENTIKPLFGQAMEISWVSSMDLNFTVNYPKWYRKESRVTGMCWNTRMTDNEILVGQDV